MITTQQEPDHCTVREAANHWGTSTKYVRDRIRAGAIQGFKLGDASDPRAPVRIRRSDVVGWMQPIERHGA
jgi:excisionase family DNA binding protein